MGFINPRAICPNCGSKIHTQGGFLLPPGTGRQCPNCGVALSGKVGLFTNQAKLSGGPSMPPASTQAPRRPSSAGRPGPPLVVPSEYFAAQDAAIRSLEGREFATIEEQEAALDQVLNQEAPTVQAAPDKTRFEIKADEFLAKSEKRVADVWARRIEKNLWPGWYRRYCERKAAETAAVVAAREARSGSSGTVD